MKKLLLMKTMLLLCALVVGSSNLWADKVSTLTFTSACEGTGTTKLDDSDATSGTVTWTVTSDAAESTFDDNRGIHYGTNGVAVTYIQLSTSSFTSGTISKIEVEASGNNTPSLSVTVGGNAFGTTVTGITTANTKYTFNGSASAGTIVVRLAKSSKAKKALYIKSVAVTYSTQQKTAHGLSWSAASKNVTYSETPYNLPTLTNPHSLAVTYDSSDKSVATIDSEGNVTIKNKTGNTTISASTEGDATYAAGTVTYTLNVTRKVIIEDGVFNFGFGPDDGGDYGSGMTQGSSIIENESETWTAGNITLVVANRYAWNTDGKMVIYKLAGGASAAGSITISCPAGKAITRIELTGPAYSSGTGALSNIAANTGTYTVTSSSAIWTGAAQSITFTASNSTYINAITVTYGDEVTTEVQSYGWASYIAPVALEFSANTAYVVTEASVANGLTLAPVTQVPAGTPLLLKGAGEKSATVIASASAPATNLLTVCNGTIATGKYAYVLAKNGEGACFKQWTGSAATLNGRVVLVLDEAVATSRSIFNLDDETTSIKNIETSKSNIDGFYNLAGQRVAQPTKGLYIVNGRKVIVK